MRVECSILLVNLFADVEMEAYGNQAAANSAASPGRSQVGNSIIANK